MKDVYVMLDSTRKVSQNIQHLIIGNFAKEAGLSISFYGAEFMALESFHFQLLSYARNSDYKAFLLYSIYQLYDPLDGFIFSIIHDILLNNKSIYFSAEKISLETINEFNKLMPSLIVAHSTIKNKSILKRFSNLQLILSKNF